MTSSPENQNDPGLLKKSLQFLQESAIAGRSKLAITALGLRNRPKKILQHPNPILDKVADYVLDFDQKKLGRLLSQMTTALMNQSHGMQLGIAAPQIGVSQRVIIVEGVPMINPEWNPVSGLPTVEILEACYSLPFGAIYKVQRAQYGWAKWYDINGNLHEMKLKGMQAIVFQHELDHLNGLCCNKTGVFTKDEALEKKLKGE